MIREIHGAPHDLRIAAFKNWDLLNEVDTLNAVADAAWGEIYTAIKDGKSHIAYWDGYTCERPVFKSFMRYALHCSTKRDRFLQLSVMEIRDGEVVPTSDTQHDTLKSFLGEVPIDDVVTVLQICLTQGIRGKY